MAFSARGQSPQAIPQAPAYNSFTLDPTSQTLTINYSLGAVVHGRSAVTDAVAAEKSQILINTTAYWPTFPDKATIKVALTYGKRVPYTFDIPDAKWNKDKNQYGLTTEQLAPFAKDLANSATSSLKDLDQAHPIPLPGRATLQITPDATRPSPVDSSIQIVFQQVDKIVSNKAESLKRAREAQDRATRAQLQNNVAQAQNVKAQAQATKAKAKAASALAKGAAGAAELAVATAQVAEAELEVLGAQQQVAQAQQQQLLSQQNYAQATSPTPSTDAQLKTIADQQAVIKAQQDATEAQLVATDKLQRATDVAQQVIP